MGGEGRAGTEVVSVEQSRLLAKFGERYSVEPDRVYKTLVTTVFRDAKSADQVMALLIVADQYGLNPFLKEIYAFPDKSGGIVPVVGIDGWNRIAQQHPQFDGLDLRYADELDTLPGAKPCPRWIEGIVYRKDRGHPIAVREYLGECFRDTLPWKSHTSRMLRHKAIIQAYRVAFGFHGIYDPDEAESFVDITPVAVVPTPGRHGKEGGMTLEVKGTEVVHVNPGDLTETATEDAAPEMQDDGTGL
jgi:phage recombination protein Bet